MDADGPEAGVEASLLALRVALALTSTPTEVETFLWVLAASVDVGAGAGSGPGAGVSTVVAEAFTPMSTPTWVETFFAAGAGAGLHIKPDCQPAAAVSLQCRFEAAFNFAQAGVTSGTAVHTVTSLL